VQDRSHGLEKGQNVLSEQGPLLGAAQDDQEPADDGVGLGNVDQLVEINHVVRSLRLPFLGAKVREPAGKEEEDDETLMK